MDKRIEKMDILLCQVLDLRREAGAGFEDGDMVETCKAPEMMELAAYRNIYGRLPQKPFESG